MKQTQFLAAFDNAYSAKDGAAAKQNQAAMKKCLATCSQPDVNAGNITTIYTSYRQ